jgi:hypothetical protein
MWKRVKLPLSLAVFVPAWAVLGGFSTLDSGAPTWRGLTVGAVIGVFFGLVFDGNHRWQVWDYTFGPERLREEDDRRASNDNETF